MIVSGLVEESHAHVAIVDVSEIVLSLEESRELLCGMLTRVHLLKVVIIWNLIIIILALIEQLLALVIQNLWQQTRR